MRYTVAADADAAVEAGAAPGALFYAGGTTVVDLLKLGVLSPDLLVDVGALPLGRIEPFGDSLRVGANVGNNDLAWHPVVRERYPVLSEAVLAGATAQLRNMATVAGNLCQRTRCPYFRDPHAACNKRAPGSGCAALAGVNRMHAVLGGSPACVAVFPSDLCTALAILDVVVATLLPGGRTRAIPFAAFHVPPGDTPHVENVLERGELITHLDLAPLALARRSAYVKVRDRASYEFALASAAVAVDVSDGTITDARVALGGVATTPWRSLEAEAVLVGGPATRASFEAAAEAALAPAVPLAHNGFKVELARRTLVRALAAVVA